MLRTDSPATYWQEQRKLVLEHYSPEVLAEVAAVLRQRRYERIARVPARKSLLAGLPREPILLFNHLWGSEHRLFSLSASPDLHSFILEKSNPGLGYLHRVLFLNHATTRPDLRRHFSDSLIDRLLATKALREVDGSLEFTLSFVPFRDLLLVRDPYPVYQRSNPDDYPDLVWLGSDSILLARYLPRYLAGRRFMNALEVGVGTGIQTFVAAQYADRAVGIDLNRRAIAFSRINAHINSVRNVELIESNLFENVHDPFDLILANPWYCDLKSGGLEEIPGILAGLDEHLRPGGMLIMLVTSYVRDGRDTVLENAWEFLKTKGSYDMDVEVVGYNVDRRDLKEYRQHRIDYSVNCFMIFRKGGTGRVRRRDASLLRRARDFSYIRAAKALGAVKY